MSQQEDDMKRYSAEDLQRYHSGNMPEREMHALEKAALDDPFLADALEGYAFTNAAGTDINELKEKVSHRSATKVVSINPKPFSIFWRAAAVLIVTGTVAWFLLKKNEPSTDNELAIATQKAASAQVQERINDTTATVGSIQQPAVSFNVDKQSTEKKLPTASGTYTIDSISANGSAAVTLSASQTNTWLATDSTKLYRDIVAAEKPNLDTKLEGKTAGIVVTPQSNAAINLRGRVTDNKGQPVAFANVFDTRNRTGTMTDKDGGFDFISHDSIATVSVNAVGYKSINGELRNNASNYLVLEETDKSLREVVVTGVGKKKEQGLYYKKATADPKFDNRRITVTNAIPVNGWDNFYKYVGDSLKTLQQVDPSFSSIDVTVSFDVDDTGHPIDITAKSACSACEAEAIRIIKNGPAWLLNKKKKKAKAVVRF